MVLSNLLTKEFPAATHGLGFLMANPKGMLNFDIKYVHAYLPLEHLAK